MVLEPSIAGGFSVFLQENDCVDSKEKKSLLRAVNSQNPIPSKNLSSTMTYVSTGAAATRLVRVSAAVHPRR